MDLGAPDLPADAFWLGLNSFASALRLDFRCLRSSSAVMGVGAASDWSLDLPRARQSTFRTVAYDSAAPVALATSAPVRGISRLLWSSCRSPRRLRSMLPVEFVPSSFSAIVSALACLSF